MTLLIAIAIAGFLSASVAAVAGFGIGSLLTPLLASHFGMRTAVSLVAIPHFVATLLRFLKLRRHLDLHVFRTFGVMNAVGALAGALLHSAAGNPVLVWVLAGLLVFAGLLNVSGYATRLRFSPLIAWPAGAASGFLGGLVGNQGSIRSAALLGLDIESGRSFVATATAIGLLVDIVRLPIYLANDLDRIVTQAPAVFTAIGAVIVGTYAGAHLLQRIPDHQFRRLIGALLIATALFLILEL